jgi:hypothetical protein
MRHEVGIQSSEDTALRKFAQGVRKADFESSLLLGWKRANPLRHGVCFKKGEGHKLAAASAAASLARDFIPFGMNLLNDRVNDAAAQNMQRRDKVGHIGDAAGDRDRGTQPAFAYCEREIHLYKIGCRKVLGHGGKYSLRGCRFPESGALLPGCLFEQDRDCRDPADDLTRFATCIQGIVGKRLTWKALTQRPSVV